jgi:hypothetical protein
MKEICNARLCNLNQAAYLTDLVVRYIVLVEEVVDLSSIPQI